MKSPWDLNTLCGLAKQLAADHDAAGDTDDPQRAAQALAKHFRWCTECDYLMRQKTCPPCVEGV